MSANQSNRQIAGIVSLFALSSLALFGCGGGNGSAGVVATPTRATVASTPNSINETGGVATYTLDINHQVSVDPATVVINVRQTFAPTLTTSDPTSAAYLTAVASATQDKTGSLTNGPQVMTPVPGVKNRWTYQVTFPSPLTTTPPTLNFAIPSVAYFTAKDTKGNPVGIAYIGGTSESSVFSGPVNFDPGAFNLIDPSLFNGGLSNPVTFNPFPGGTTGSTSGTNLNFTINPPK